MVIGNTRKTCTALHHNIGLFERHTPLPVVNKLSERGRMLDPTGFAMCSPCFWGAQDVLGEELWILTVRRGGEEGLPVLQPEGIVGELD